MDMISLDMDSRSLVMDYLRRVPPETSELTFTNLFVWRKKRPMWILDLKGVLVLLCQIPDVTGMYVLGPPVGGHPDPHLLRSEIPDLKGYIRITRKTASALERAGLIVTPDIDNSDYVYRTTDLAELKGEKYHKKRNLVSQCLKAYHSDYIPITHDLIPDCIGSLDQCRVFLSGCRGSFKLRSDP